VKSDIDGRRTPRARDSGARSVHLSWSSGAIALFHAVLSPVGFVAAAEAAVMRAAASADDAAERADPAGSSSGRGADEPACVGYVFSEKKRGSLLTPQFVERAGCAGRRHRRCRRVAASPFRFVLLTGALPHRTAARSACASCRWTRTWR
jgi:hypothetical protein